MITKLVIDGYGVFVCLDWLKVDYGDFLEAIFEGEIVAPRVVNFYLKDVPLRYFLKYYHLLPFNYWP